MPSKKVKESEGFIVSWNKKRKGKRQKDFTFFVRHKKLDKQPIPKKPKDLVRFLIDKAKEIEKK